MEKNIKKFEKILIANRGEIAIRIMRACKELGIDTIAIYTKEDSKSLFRTKADQSYQIGKNMLPVEAYLNMDEIIHVAKEKGADAIHPGYGFLSENPEFARKCKENGIEFIGPSAEVIESLGDKVSSKIIAEKAGVPTIPGEKTAIKNDEEAKEFAKKAGYPIMLKASAGGGGRGMRIVKSEEELFEQFHQAKSEAKKAFGNDDIFIEKYIDSPKHIEVQIFGDKFGNIVHLFERDCSIQRRHQKIIEFTPAVSLPEEIRKKICDDAVKIAKYVNYQNAGTVEFLVDKDLNHYFIEVNPRIQVEHTVTEETTGIDLVQSQILVAQGYSLDSDEIGITSQESIRQVGFAIQNRVTTEDPQNGFAPDTGKIDVYRSGSGNGIRLDGGNGFTGAEITPYYDSLLVKITSHGRRFEDAIRKSLRALSETKVSGVKTNIPFLINVLNHPDFKDGKCTTKFIEDNPNLFDFIGRKDTERKVLEFIGNVIVNQTQGKKPEFSQINIPRIEKKENLRGTRQILLEKGAKGVIEWIKSQDRLLITDTTLRDAHQSLMATRVRTRDMTAIAEATALKGKDLFSLEMWGGATFDVAYRFLNESPWERLRKLREKIPNIMFQMLFRGPNAVGYKNYPDNVIKEFIKEASREGIDLFRIFDSLNWLENMRVSLDAVLEEGKLAEVTMCYTGDILDTTRDKYCLKYYVNLAKEIEKSGAHILGIKDMSALLKPYAAFKLVKALKDEISIPIHLHTHDTTGNGVATVIMASEAGVDIADTAFNSMSGITSQPPLNSVVAALKNTSRDTGIDMEDADEISHYWESIRPIYSKFESDLVAGSTEIYKYEIPGGQYSNLKPQVESFGLGDRFKEVKEMYREVNFMVGDIIKVTPSSKMVGDMAIFMVQNDLTPENILEKGKNLTFPDSAVTYFIGMMGQPEGGFPEDLQKIVLKGEKPITVRPGELLADEDFGAISDLLEEELGEKPTMQQCLSYALYPKVYMDYLKNQKKYSDLSNMPSDVFFWGLREGETSHIEIKDGKTLIVKLLEIGKHNEEGEIRLSFEINGNRRDVMVFDENYFKPGTQIDKTPMAEESNDKHLGASIPGKIAKIHVKEGDKVKEGQSLIIVEAMKMENAVIAPKDVKISKILVTEGEEVQSGQLLMEFE